jgi:hypothetical protein
MENLMRKILLVICVAMIAQTASAAQLKSNIYGFVEGYFEQVDKAPVRSGSTATTEGKVSDEDQPHEFDTPNISIMVKSSKGSKFSSFLNINATDALETRNAWVEMKLKGEKAKFRIGKLYRPFGLYNERLDAVPTYIGVEPPELFDGDHLLVTRTTNMMFHGEFDVSGNVLRYALTTGNDERKGGEIPLGGDVRYTMYTDNSEWTIGSSFYFSNTAVPTKAVGDGSPDGGVANWMSEDEYKVLSLYTEFIKDSFTFQAGYFNANHDAKRSGTKLQNMDTDALNQQQIKRLCKGDMSTCADSEVNYDIETWYIRTGYSFETSIGEVTPYVQWDVYHNPESVFNKDNGGDKEAGLADDGKFTKQTLGAVFRPERELAIKVDASNHSQKVDGDIEDYSEVRASFSYLWSI